MSEFPEIDRKLMERTRGREKGYRPTPTALSETAALSMLFEDPRFKDLAPDTYLLHREGKTSFFNGEVGVGSLFTFITAYLMMAASGRPPFLPEPVLRDVKVAQITKSLDGTFLKTLQTVYNVEERIEGIRTRGRGWLARLLGGGGG